MITFKDEALQKKYGGQLAKLFSPHMEKLSILESTRGTLPLSSNTLFTESKLIQLLLDGEGTYWSLKRNSKGDITGYKPYTAGSTLRKLHKIAKRKRKYKFTDTFADFDARGGLR